MKRSLLVMVVSVLVSFGAASAASAEDGAASPEADQSRVGPYVAVAAAYAWATDFGGEAKTGGLNTRLGFRFWKYMSAEALYEWGADNPGAWTVGGNLKAYPITGNIQPFVLVGASYWDLDSRGSDAGVRAGIGLDGYISDHFYLTGGVDYVWGTGDLSDVNFCTLYAGVGYRL